MKENKKHWFLWLLCACFALSLAACGKSVSAEKTERTVTLLNGAHYTVKGENKKTADASGAVSFEIELERGYKAVGAYGNDCEITSDCSFTQTVQFKDVPYKLTVRLKTEKMQTRQVRVHVKDANFGNVHIRSVLGVAQEGVYYVDDLLQPSASASEGYGFHCWSTGGYLREGGELRSYSRVLQDFDFATDGELYANFRLLSDTKDFIAYEMREETVLQDCAVMLLHHSRANTLTAVDMRERGIDCDSKLLVGWEREDGTRVGLGSRTAVEGNEATKLKPVWKECTDKTLFTADNGVLTGYTDSGAREVVVPNEIGGEKITAIGANAFRNCTASAYYLPDTVTTVEDNAFLGCENLIDFYMSDNIMNITDSAFAGCKNFTTVHINAVLKPRYSMEVASVKTDVYDRLMADKEASTPKIVLLGGSSVFYGYNSVQMKQALANKYALYNLGYNMGTCGYIQYELLSSALREGDIFLHAPESADSAWSGYRGISVLTGKTVYFLSDTLPFVFMEGNWNFTETVTVHKYGDFFARFADFNYNRIQMSEQNYADYVADSAYNRYGDYSISQTGDTNYIANLNNIYFANVSDDAITNANKSMYKDTLQKGVKVFTTFAPVNRNYLRTRYGDDQTVNAKAAEYTQRVKNLCSSGTTVLLTQNDTIYGGECFSNTDWHLGYPFRDTHTEKITNALIAALQEQGGTDA